MGLRFLVALLAASVCVLVGGCAVLSDDRQAAERIAAAHGMHGTLVTGTRFQHLVYTQGNLNSSARVHVYLEGDGMPWTSPHRVASDPTPRNPLALQLMASDSSPAIYVGRPCYFGLADATGCSPWWWTHGRYSAEVVESLSAVIERVLQRGERQRVTLIGYSGGGVLAALIAERLGGVDTLVTVAANLDIHAWADRHGYSRLAGSLNPADQAPLAPSIRQLHLVGEQDGRVPPGSIERYLVRNRQATSRIMPGFDHVCCWVARWPAVLAEIR
jgi:hypothetical protein